MTARVVQLVHERETILRFLDDLRARAEGGDVGGFAFVCLNRDGSISNAYSIEPGANELTLLGGVECLRDRIVDALVR